MNASVILVTLIFGPFAAAVCTACFGEKRERLRWGLTVFFLAAEFALASALAIQNPGSIASGDAVRCELQGLCGLGLTFQADGFRMLYGCIAAFLWLISAILSGEYFREHRNQKRYYTFLLLTLGAVMGVFFSQDLFTTYVFFEIMSFTSCVWVAQEESREALSAANTYLAVAVLGGMVMLMGLFLVYRGLGTLDFDGMLKAVRTDVPKPFLFPAGICILIGFGVKAGVFPLHIWLPKAHPVAPAPASALLSGVLTKTGVFGILVLTTRLFPGSARWGLIILGLGVLTMLGGAVLAVFAMDLKRVLACSSMSQIGFILVGTGMSGLLGEEGAPAAGGVFLHAINHSLIKLVLFLAAGVIYSNTHALDLNQIRGFGRKKPLLNGIFLIGALAISGIPFFAGYVSKTLLHESILAYGGAKWVRAVEALFLVSGGLTAAYMTKLYVAVFVEKNQDSALQEQYGQKKKYWNRKSGAALTVSAAVLLIWGLFPHRLMDRAASLTQSFLRWTGEEQPAAYFAWENLKGAAVTVIIGVLVYVLIVRLLLRDRNGQYADRWPGWLDLEKLIYRPLLLEIVPAFLGVLCRMLDSLPDAAVVLLRKTVYRDSPLPAEREEGNIVTEKLGRLLNRSARIKRRLQGRDAAPGRDYVHLCAMKFMEVKESGGIIARSLSFGLLLFGIGLFLTLIYILF